MDSYVLIYSQIAPIILGRIFQRNLSISEHLSQWCPLFNDFTEFRTYKPIVWVLFKEMLLYFHYDILCEKMMELFIQVLFIDEIPGKEVTNNNQWLFGVSMLRQ